MNKTRLKILMVEDDPQLGACFQNLMAELGHELTFFSDGKSAIDFVTNHSGPFDLAFIDFSMPGATGDKVIRAMMESPRTTFGQIFLFTGMVETHPPIARFLEAMSQFENIRYMHKDPEELKQVLNTFEHRKIK